MDHDPNSSPSGDRLVAARLADEAARLDVGTPMVEVVIQRGRQRQQRRRTAVGVLSVAGVCAAAIVCVNVLSRPADQRALTSPDDTSLPAAGTWSAYTSAQLVESNLVWSQFEPESAAAVSFLNGTADLTGDGPYVVWSTAPGVNGGKATMWRSDDGLSWQQVDNLPTFSSADVVEHNGRFLAFGTAPAPASTSGGRSVESIATSEDGGITWATQALPIDTSELENEPGVASVSVHASSIAAGPAGVLAVVRQSVDLEWEKLVPPEVKRSGYNTTPLGIQVVTPNACGDSPVGTAPTETTSVDGAVNATSTIVTPADGATVPACPPSTAVATTVQGNANTRAPLSPATTLTWAELGVSDRAGVATVYPEIRLFFAADGVTFEEVNSPAGTDRGYADVRLTDTTDGFVAAVVTYDDAGISTNELFHTTDGQSWTDLGPAPLAYPEGFGAIGDRLVMSSWVQDSAKPSNPATTAVAVRDPNGTWTTTLLNDLVLPSDGVLTSLSGGGLAVGPDGITMVAMLYVDPVAEVGGVDVTENGITLQADTALTQSFRFLDESGAELGRTENGMSTSPLVTMDPLTGEWHVRRTEHGEVAATFTGGEIYEQLPPDAGVPTALVLHSTDGVAWSRESLDDLVGAPVGGTGGIRVTDTQVIVAANLAGQKNADGTPKQILLLGTPKT